MQVKNAVKEIRGQEEGVLQFNFQLSDYRTGSERGRKRSFELHVDEVPFGGSDWRAGSYECGCCWTLLDTWIEQISVATYLNGSFDQQSLTSQTEDENEMAKKASLEQTGHSCTEPLEETNPRYLVIVASMEESTTCNAPWSQNYAFYSENMQKGLRKVVGV